MKYNLLFVDNVLLLVIKHCNALTQPCTYMVSNISRNYWNYEHCVFSKSRKIPENFGKIPGNPGNSPENPAGKFGVFSYFQAVIAYKRL